MPSTLRRRMGLWLALALLPVTAAARDEPAATWTATCTFAGTRSKITFASRSGDAYEDDMTVLIESADGPQQHWPLPEALYLPTDTVIDIGNRCEGLVAAPLDDGSMVFVKRDMRPGFTHAQAFLVDGRGQMLGESLDLGTLKQDVLVLRRAGEGYDVRIVREYLDNSRCDCAEAMIEDWLRVSRRGGRLHAEWVDRGG